MANNRGYMSVIRDLARAEHRPKFLRPEPSLDESTLPGISVVGAGYDPFAGYASPRYIVDSGIFDWANAQQDTFTYLEKTYKKPSAINAIVYSDSLSNSVVGTDIQSYQERLGANIKVDGSYGFFSGSISAEFGLESLTKSECEFSRFQESIGTWALELTLNSNTRDLLKATFREELDELNTSDNEACKNFFQRHGSHILTGVVLGGSTLRTASTNKYTVERKYDLSVVAQEAYKSETAQVSAEEKAKYASAVSSFNTNSSVTRNTVGGNPQLGDGVFDGDKSTFKEWSKSVIEDPVFVEFTPDNPFTPIWELCANDTKGQEVRKGLSSYYEGHWVPEYVDRLRLRPDYIDSLTIVHGNSSTISPTPGYIKFNYDLNSTVGGEFIYLCYHKVSYDSLKQNKDAITDLVVLFDNEDTPSGYKKLSTDLNAGAKGKFIYLAYKEGSYNSDTAILDVTVFGSKHYDVAPPYGFTKINHDLNAGAGGDYIFFGYAKRSA
ncbi:MAC/Perforin domain-containing protein [Hypomontagnella submonticulosa]|nr:MAC/Perforin domain-containing protein [Hypomontagnella submonticulosa]